MDWLTFALQVAFFAPIAIRTLSGKTRNTAVFDDLALNFKRPALLVHELGLLLAWTGWGIGFWTDRVARQITWLGLAAVFCLSLSTLLMFWSFAVLRSWRLLPTIEKGHELCMSGPYHLIRHPIYLAFDLQGVGIALSSPTALATAGAVLLIAGGELRARQEEKALTEAFGRNYSDYMRQVHRTIPGVY